jgi:hypothetical protein
MPKLPINYENACIYEIVCKDVNITERYVGSTTNLIQRRRDHKSRCNNEKGKDCNQYVYRFIRANGSFENWDVVLIERVIDCKDKEHLHKRERFYIEEKKAELNKNIPLRTLYENNKDKIAERMKEYRESNKDKIAKQKKEFYENNKEKTIEKAKDYYEKNKEKIAEKGKEYRESNKDKIAERQKEYYEKNKEKALEKAKDYYEKNKEKIVEQKKEYNEKNKEKINERQRIYYANKK